MTAPATRLREAARVLREAAEKATPGPWQAVPHDRSGHVVTDADAWDQVPTWDDELNEDGIEYVSLAMGTTLPVERNGALRMPGGYEPQHELIEYELGQITPAQQAEAVASIRWIALASPAIAEDQAALLDAISDVVEARPNWLAGRVTTPALALADAIRTAAGRQP